MRTAHDKGSGGLRIAMLLPVLVLVALGIAVRIEVSRTVVVHNDTAMGDLLVAVCVVGRTAARPATCFVLLVNGSFLGWRRRSRRELCGRIEFVDLPVGYGVLIVSLTWTT